MEVNGQLHALASLLPGKAPCTQEAGWYTRASPDAVVKRKKCHH